MASTCRVRTQLCLAFSEREEEIEQLEPLRRCWSCQAIVVHNGQWRFCEKRPCKITNLKMLAIESSFQVMQPCSPTIAVNIFSCMQSLTEAEYYAGMKTAVIECSTRAYNKKVENTALRVSDVLENF